MNDTPSGITRSTQDAVEIRLWEIYLLRSRNNLFGLLSGYSLDKGPYDQALKEPERVTFRFMLYDWEKSVMPLLSQYSIPFEIVQTFKIDVFQHRTKKKICIVEDDLDILFALNTIMEDAGYDVLLSHCGRPILESSLPRTDLFILDRKMPDVDGIDVCRHLKTQPSTKNVPVIMISASRDFEDQAFKAGVDRCLEKPFQMQELLRLVSLYTDRGVETSPLRVVS